MNFGDDVLKKLTSCARILLHKPTVIAKETLFFFNVKKILAARLSANFMFLILRFFIMKPFTQFPAHGINVTMRLNPPMTVAFLDLLDSCYLTKTQEILQKTFHSYTALRILTS